MAPAGRKGVPMSEQPTAAAESAGHAATVVAMYEAFGRGDVPFVLEQLADDVEWD